MSIHRLIGPNVPTAPGAHESQNRLSDFASSSRLAQSLVQVATAAPPSVKQSASKVDLKRELRLAVTVNREGRLLVNEGRHLQAQIVTLKSIVTPSPEQQQELERVCQAYETTLSQALVKIRDAADVLSGQRLPSSEDARSLFKRTYMYYQQRIDGLKNANRLMAFFKVRYYDPRKSTSIGLVQLARQEQHCLAQQVAQLKSILGITDHAPVIIDLFDWAARNAYLSDLPTEKERDAVIDALFAGQRYVVKAPPVSSLFTDAIKTLVESDHADHSDVLLAGIMATLEQDLSKMEDESSHEIHGVKAQARMSFREVNEAVDRMIRHPFLLRFGGRQHKAQFSRLLMLLSTQPQAIGQDAPHANAKQQLWLKLIHAFPDCTNERVVEQLMYKARHTRKPLDPAVLIFLHCPTLVNMKHYSDGAPMSRSTRAKEFGIMSLSKEERRVHKFYHGDSFFRWPFLWLVDGFRDEELHFLHAPGHIKGSLAQAPLTQRRDKIGGFAGVISYFFNRTHPDVDVIHHEQYKVNQPTDYSGRLISYSEAMAFAKRAVPNNYLATRPPHQRLFNHRINSPLISQRELLFTYSEESLDQLAEQFSAAQLSRAKTTRIKLAADSNPAPRLVTALKDGFLNFLTAQTLLRDERGDGKGARVQLSRLTPPLYNNQTHEVLYDNLNLEDANLRNGLQKLICGRISGDQGETTVQLLTKAYKLIQCNRFVDATPVADYPPDYEIPQSLQPAGTLTHVLTDTRMATLIVDAVNELAALSAIDKATLEHLDTVIDPNNPAARIRLTQEWGADGRLHCRFAGVSNQDDPHTMNYLLRMANHAYHLHWNLNEIKKKVMSYARSGDVHQAGHALQDLPAYRDQLMRVIGQDQLTAIKPYPHINVDGQPGTAFGTHNILFQELIKQYGASTNDPVLQQRAAQLNGISG